MSGEWYTLDENKVPVRTRDEKSAFGGDRHVALTNLANGGIQVSTVFLGLDHGYDNGPPVLFETLVFGGLLDGEMERYCTWDEAEQGHEAMVDRVRSALDS